MANQKDNNADLGNQTIEGTQPPIALDVEIVMPDGTTQPLPVYNEQQAPTAEQLDEQLADLMNATEEKPQQQDNLDDMLAALMNEQPEQPAQPAQSEEPIIMTPPPPPENADVQADALDDMLAALMNETEDAQPAQSEEPIIMTPPPPSENTDAQADALDDMLAALMNETEDAQPAQSEEPIIMAPPPPENTSNQANETVVQPETVQTAAAPETPVEQTFADSANSANDEQARAMMEQAQQIMEQARRAQIEAQAQMEVAQEQARQVQAQMQAQMQAHSQPQQIPVNNFDPNSAAAGEAARAMIQQAQLMMQQAQQAQMQAQQAAQQAAHQAQMQAQLQAQQVRNTATPVITDPYALKEVDRLKNELDGMRDLVNKLTYSIAQAPNSAQQNMQAMPPHYGYGDDRDQYRKLESELDRMRRDILEKDLRDREKELDRRQKEAESNVKDIRPEMIQMSDSRDIAPVGAPPQSGILGGEYIPLANGVFYSTRDKQVYVMTAANNAAAASPTIEPRRPAAPKKKAAPPPRRPAARRRPSGPHRPGRRPMGRGGRPTHR